MPLLWARVQMPGAELGDDLEDLHHVLRSRAAGYLAADDQALVSPDSKPSKKTHGISAA